MRRTKCKAPAWFPCSKANRRTTGGKRSTITTTSIPGRTTCDLTTALSPISYKLVHFYGPDCDYWELFDRQQDPLELTSVCDTDTYASVRKDLKSQLARLRSELKVPEQDPPEASGQRRQPPQGKAAKPST